MAKKAHQCSVPTVTLQFTGDKARQLADHFWIDWLDGGLDQTWEGNVALQGITDAIEYDWDPDTRTIIIRADDS
ncbi:hypothetical protein [Hoeflea ulvae]|uniref:Uncharacterized protein n=1 Tax=Hoeflea ulvae TaxID=2983764 RepID=A0ABT3YL12_9HYPH|nr:hypothetical protein [Hoeflea ulvae]MCY0096287.1 hypothetical protein [Hoeflea ulvae]